MRPRLAFYVLLVGSDNLHALQPTHKNLLVKLWVMNTALSQSFPIPYFITLATGHIFTQPLITFGIDRSMLFLTALTRP